MEESRLWIPAIEPGHGGRSWIRGPIGSIEQGEVHQAFAHLAGVTFKRAWRRGPDDPALTRVAEILRKAADDIEQALAPSRAV